MLHFCALPTVYTPLVSSMPFVQSTLLLIETSVYYDRVLLMDAGRVAEFDTPLNLFDKEDSIFRSLCDQAGLSRDDILRIKFNVSDAAVAMPDGAGYA